MRSMKQDKGERDNACNSHANARYVIAEMAERQRSFDWRSICSIIRTLPSIAQPFAINLPLSGIGGAGQVGGDAPLLNIPMVSLGI
jgi:hypothetical protein